MLVGVEDSISPAEEMRRMAEAIPGAKFVAIEGAGHMAPLERPREVSRGLGDFSGGAQGIWNSDWLLTMA